MKKYIIGSVLIVFVILATSAQSGVERVEISPAALVNLSQSHSSSFMGGAVTGDVFLSQNFALRTTVGFTKNRYYPEELNYNDADYSFWMSFAPYFEMNVGRHWRPYVSFSGSFGSGNAGSSLSVPANLEQSPYAQMRPVSSRDNLFSLGGTVGSKFKVYGSISLFAEASYYFYSNADNFTFSMSGYPYLDQTYSAQNNPAYFSFGLTYAFDVKK